MPRGSKPGERRGGRQPGVPNKATADIKAAAAEFSDQALAVLVSVMNGEQQPSAARVAAANAVLDRAHGKPKQAMDIDANVKAAIQTVERLIVKAPNPHG